MDEIKVAPGTYQGQKYPVEGGEYVRADDGSLTQAEKPTAPHAGKSAPAPAPAPTKKKGA